MKRILLTGANSYIGTSFENYINQWSAKYQVDTVDMVDGTWEEKSFAGYDSVFHVAGILYQKETKENEPVYYNVNRNLAIETAKKAKAQGIKHFFLLKESFPVGELFNIKCPLEACIEKWTVTKRGQYKSHPQSHHQCRHLQLGSNAYPKNQNQLYF